MTINQVGNTRPIWHSSFGWNPCSAQLGGSPDPLPLCLAGDLGSSGLHPRPLAWLVPCLFLQGEFCLCLSHYNQDQCPFLSSGHFLCPLAVFLGRKHWAWPAVSNRNSQAGKAPSCWDCGHGDRVPVRGTGQDLEALGNSVTWLREVQVEGT